jgi:uncharacterized protein YggE
LSSFSPILTSMCASDSDVKANSSGIPGKNCVRQRAVLNLERIGDRTSVFRSSGCRRSLLRLAAIFLSGLSVAQTQVLPQRNGPPSLRVHGSATITAEPNQARFDIGVVTQAATAKAATDQNTSQSSALVQQLSAAFPEASIKSVNFSVNPVYEYPREGAPKIAGYTANNTVRLLLNDLAKLSTVIDIAIRSGASSINRLSFTLKEEDSARAQALATAARQAQASAKALAESLNLKLTRLLIVEQGQPVILSPTRELSFEKIQSTNVAPISPGTIDVHADVDLTYEVIPSARRDISNATGSENTSR